MIKKRKKRTPYKILKDKAWKLCSIYIRLRNVNEHGFVKCYTCNTTKHYKEMQAGHLVDGRTGGILFDERGIRPQCYGCNVCHGGRPLIFLIELEKEIGKERAYALRDELMQKKNKPTSLTLIDLQEWVSYFESKLTDLE